jgi:type I restriction enzyme R subunit
MAERLTEQETRSRYITPALTAAGWDLHAQIREELRITDGQVLVRGQLHTRGEAKRADYVLFYKPNIPLAVVEAKDMQHRVDDGLQQAIDYASMWDIPFAASSNGQAFMIHDSTAGPGEKVEREISLDAFPSPAVLWQRLMAHKGLTVDQQAVVAEGYYTQDDKKTARYYQAVAVNRAVEAVARGQKRLLLVMATGTGKTFTAFQIIWRLREAGLANRVLFLVDRNVLADQALINDFQPFGAAMTKVTKRTGEPPQEGKQEQVPLCSREPSPTRALTQSEPSWAGQARSRKTGSATKGNISKRWGARLSAAATSSAALDVLSCHRTYRPSSRRGVPVADSG